MDGIRLANVVGIIKCHWAAKIPESKSKLAACFDLYAVDLVEIWPGETKIIGTGIKLDLHKSKKGMVYSRSGLASQGIVVANAPGIIDPDYQGEVKVLLHNSNQPVRVDNQWYPVDTKPFIVKPGDRIAQLEIVPRFNEGISLLGVDDFGAHPSERGDKGFGSTGI